MILSGFNSGATAREGGNTGNAGAVPGIAAHPSAYKRNHYVRQKKTRWIGVILANGSRMNPY